MEKVDGCLDALNFLEENGVVSQEQYKEIETSIMNLHNEEDEARADAIKDERAEAEAQENFCN